MSQIIIGAGPQGTIKLDLDILLRTRLLIQANSGKGKSWLLRRLAEQMFGKLQVILIDPEGEFPTLREKFGYVLVGKGGETPADPRSAALVCHKLLELKASAVIDLYEMKPSARHEYVRRFFEAAIDAPKTLWHPCAFMLDEAHTLPEKGTGESESSEAVIGMATRGRKRGFCLIPATQRLGKLRKDAAAEMLNLLIGGTMIDIDRKRAADALGVYGADQHRFFDEIKLLERGTFYALGPAISDERIIFKVGQVETTHPEAGSARAAAAPPPAPEKIKALLPQLADLPKQAEEKARTEAELRGEIRRLEGELRKSAKRPPEPNYPDRTAEVLALQRANNRLVEIFEEWQKTVMKGEAILREFADSLRPIAKLQAPKPIHIKIESGNADLPTAPALPRAVRGHSAAARPPSLLQLPLQEQSHNGLTGPEHRILDAIAWLESLGQQAPRQVAVAFLADYSFGGGAFNNPRGALRSKGLVEYAGDGIRLTEEGRALAHWPEEALTPEELQRRVMERLDGPKQRILRVLLDRYPKAISKEECAQSCDPPYAMGGAFNNPCGALRSLGLIDYPEPGKIVALPLLFLEGE